MKILFKGEPNHVVIDKFTKKVMFKFNEEGKFITEDLYIISRARNYFDSEEVLEDLTEEKEEVIKVNESENNNKEKSNEKKVEDIEKKPEGADEARKEGDYKPESGDIKQDIASEFVCHKCGKVCKSKLGLDSHIKACKVGE